MSIADRVDDARLLYRNGRGDGALLSLLVAVAATSRRRFPRPARGRRGHPQQPTDTDGGAFEAFLAAELPKTTRINNFTIHFRGQQRRLESILYEFMRCELTH